MYIAAAQFCLCVKCVNRLSTNTTRLTCSNRLFLSPPLPSPRYDSPHETSASSYQKPRPGQYTTSLQHNISNNSSSNASNLTSPMQHLSLNNSSRQQQQQHQFMSTTTTTNHRSYHNTFNSSLNSSHGGGAASGLSEPETSEVEDGPSFREALKAFQSKSNDNSATQSPVTPRSGLRLSQQHQEAAEQLLQSSTQRIERTVQQSSSSTNRTYQMQDR